MAREVTRFAKRSAGTGARLADVSIGKAPEAASETRSIPLELGPLLAPYKRLGRISIRIERLPHRARLSGGQNNGDRSWSISLDELDELSYLFPSDLTEAHTLAIRVINLDGGDGATVAVLDYRIRPDDAGSRAGSAALSPNVAPAIADSEIRALRAELARVRDAHTKSESALVELRERNAKDWEESSRQLVERELSAVRSQWEAEVAKRLAAVTDGAEATIKARQSAWQAEHDARLLESETRAREHYTLSRERWQHEAEAALARSQEVWKAGEATRLAAAEAQWRAQGEAALSEARAHLVRKQGDDAELGRLREEVATTKRSLAGCEAELAQVRLEADQARESWRQGTEAAIARAKKDVLAERDARLAAAEKRWREQSAAELADAAAGQKRAEAALAAARAQKPSPSGQGDEVELRRLNDELKSLQTTLASRESELAQTQERSLAEIETALGRAKQEWTREQVALLAEAEARGRDESVKALQAALTSRESELSRIREKQRREVDAAIAQAREEWQSAEAAHLMQAEERVRDESVKALQIATARFEKAEQELAEARSSSAPRSADPVELIRLREELEKVKASLDVRDIELKQARSAEAQRRWTGESHLVEQHLNQHRGVRAAWTNKRDGQEKGTRPLWRDVALVACVAALLMVLYPSIEAMLPDGWLPDLGSVFGEAEPLPAKSGVTGKPHVPAAPPAVAQPADIVVRTAKVHLDPSKTSAVLATLQRDSKVAPIEQRGNWVLVPVDPDGAQPKQGWVYASYLKRAP
jgi:hypothetical protein